MSNEAALGIFLTWQSRQHAEAAAGLIQHAVMDLMAEGDQLEEDLLLLSSFLDAELSCVMQQRQLELPRQYTFHNSYWMKPCQPSFFWGTVHKYFDRRDWLLHYRMDKATFFELLGSIRHLIGLEDTNFRTAATAEQRLSCCLLYMATPITQQQVASMEGISCRLASPLYQFHTL